jgi:hypothetical protein
MLTNSTLKVYSGIAIELYTIIFEILDQDN